MRPDGPQAPSAAALVRRTRRRVTRSGWAASGAGAVVVFIAVGFLIPLFLSPGQIAGVALLNGPLVVAFVVSSAAIISRVVGQHISDTLSWITDDRVPDAGEHRRTLRLAAYAVEIDALGWVAAGFVFAVLNGCVRSWPFGVAVGATIWLGGETTCALEYLLYERILRPVVARALAAGPPRGLVAPGVQARLAMAWSLGTGAPLLGVLMLGVVGIVKPGVHAAYVAGAVLFLGAVAWVAGHTSIVFAAKAIADPLRAVRDGLGRIEAGELDVAVPVDDGSEVGLLQSGFNRMAEGLRERERIRDLFGRHVGEEVARTALSDGVRFAGEEREIGALFVDLVGSTSLALAVPPVEVVRILNRFFHVVVDVVEQSGGFVNKFEGDAALCVFGAPASRDDPAGDALRAARRLTARLADEMPDIDVGIGVSAGLAIAGNVGTERRFEYTVIGDPVNEAARLADLAKLRPERVLAAETALARAGGGEIERWCLSDSEVLRGRELPTRLAQPVV